MKLWATEILAINTEGRIVLYCGPGVEAETKEDAELYCERNGLGFCRVIGEQIEQKMEFKIYIN